MTTDAPEADEAGARPGRAASLLAGVAAGAPGSMSGLHALLHESVRAVAFEIVRDHMLAEDVVQEVFLWVWAHADRFDADRGTASAWVNVIARRRAIDLVRREVVWRRLSRTEVPRDAEVHADAADRAHRVATSMSALSPAQRSALTATFYDGHSYHEAAQRLGVKHSTLSSRVHEGLVSMRRVMDRPPT